MVLSCSPIGLVGLEKSRQGISNMVNAGFTHLFMDLQMFCSENILEKYGDEKVMERHPLLQNVKELSALLEPMLSCCKSQNVQISIARAPFLSRDTKRIDLNGYIEEITIESIRQCGSIGCRYLVVRPLFAGILPDDEWEVNRAYYMRLAKHAMEHDVILLLENQCKCVNGHLVRGICSDATEAVEWIDKLNSELGEERFGFCLDVGVCNLCGQNIHEVIKLLETHIKAVIVRDCNGNEESSQLPFTSVYCKHSQTDWMGVFRGLREIDFEGQLMLDMADTATAFPLSLRKQLLQMAGDIMQYFKWQIELELTLKKYDNIVLFGAGNMCRNFMKNYGDKYPPLFTCDNDKKIWGSRFCGLEIKSPESLKTLPETCGIFICNIYYDEIEAQLRELGITNSIERFNDEYMNSFYMDRFDSTTRQIQK